MNQKEFPTYDEFYTWYKMEQPGASSILDYFADRVRTVMPEVGKLYEVGMQSDEWEVDMLLGFKMAKCPSITYNYIRPIITPTRDEVIKKAKALGLTDAEIEVLGGVE